MTLHSETVASGPGWLVRDLVCTAGPQDRPFEEQHASVCIAAVTRGTFRYRTTEGTALLAPGAVLLGNHGHAFECGHEHGIGDRCLSIHFSPGHWEAVVAAVPGLRTTTFSAPRLPPLPSLIAHLASLEAACRDRDEAAIEELALDLAGTVTAALAGADTVDRRPSPRDQRRISEAVRRIEAMAEELSQEALSLAALAREAAMSPYHFLRTFARLVGMTPHQFVLHTRLHRAAVRIRSSDEAISAIAFEVGFDDLSTFNRRFRRLIGTSPSAYRTKGRPVSRPSG